MELVTSMVQTIGGTRPPFPSHDNNGMDLPSLFGSLVLLYQRSY